MSNEGWKCPVCGGGVAPTVERCPCVAGGKVVVTEAVPTPGVASWGHDYERDGTPKQSTVIAPSDDGWIEWKGGHGLDTDKTVVAKLRDGRTIKERGNRMDWAIHGHADDIVAYKVLP